MTDDDRIAALLPCPFCGAEPIQHPTEPLTGHAPVECPTATCPMHFLWPHRDTWQRRALAPGAEKERGEG